LTAFVLGISYFVKGVSTFSYEKALNLADPLLSKVGIDTQLVGKVAGIFTSRDFSISIDKSSQNNPETTPSEENSKPTDKEKSSSGSESSNNLDLTVALMSDSHNYNGLLGQALLKAKDKNISNVFYLGDLTDWGDVGSLENAKEVLDKSSMTYYVLPGDHDIAQSIGIANFTKVFGKNYQSVTLNGFTFLMLDNSANYAVIPVAEMEWFKGQVALADFVILHQALYYPTNDRVMGIVNGEEVKMVKAQAEEILKLIRDSKVKAVISADRHQFSENDDPDKKELKHISIGAITETRNTQKPEFDTFSIMKDGSFEVQEVVLE
jgi:predicted phosphodiesterase